MLTSDGTGISHPVGNPVKTDHYSSLLDRSITVTLSQVRRIISEEPALLLTAARLLAYQKRAVMIREKNYRKGLVVPAVIMFSLTQRCNLTCSGCYMQEQRRTRSPELSLDQIRSLVNQSVDLGVSFFVFAGGEPLIRSDDIMTLAREFPMMISAVYTNGTLITDDLATALSRLKNIVPIISVEGEEEETDSRRSSGVYAAAMHSFSLLKQNGVFFGCSVTVTRENFKTVTGDQFITTMIGYGCRLITYVEYVPVKCGTEELVLSGLQHDELNLKTGEFQGRYPALFLAFPGDESSFDGCLSAGRGFIHVSPSGDLEPCPAAPFSDTNITRMSLKEALQSGFLARVRNNHHNLSETQGGCALWKNREWTESLLR